MAPSKNEDNRRESHLLDYLLYVLAGIVFAALSYTILLWLQF